jgi:hypothetical protein
MSTENDFKITSYDPDAIKSSLIAFMQTKPDFVDFNYEGSAINTIIDLLVRNTHYMAFLANMTANESFLGTAQIRSNVVSHAQKLSYVPKSRTASTAAVSLLVTPFAPSPKNNITMTKGSTFINTIDGVQYSFTNPEESILFKTTDGKFLVENVILKQGQLVSQKYTYTGQPIVVVNKNVDTSTLKMYVRASVTAERFEFVKAEDITQPEINERVFFLSENTSGSYEVEFGKGILGEEPVVGSIVELEYVAVPVDHANGLGTLIAASTISGFSNITVTVLTPAFGGSEKDDIERIRFIAPRIYKAQNRAVTESDFVGIVLRDFPFIKAAIAWGGEKNVPPYYGRVFLSLIPIDGYEIVDSVKRSIEIQLQKYTIMATPFVIDATYINLDLVLDYIFDDTKTSDTYQIIESKIGEKVASFGEASLRQFEFWYNNSELVDLIKDIPGVKSIQIRKNAFIEFATLKTKNNKYVFSFENVITPGTFSLKDYVLDISTTADVIADDGAGSLVRTFTKAGVTATQTVGTINYLTGDVVFTVQFLSMTTDTLKAYVTPTLDNFYTERNNVVSINSSVINRTTQKRN